LQLIQGIMALTLQSHSEIVPPFQLHPLLHCESSLPETVKKQSLSQS